MLLTIAGKSVVGTKLQTSSLSLLKSKSVQEDEKTSAGHASFSDNMSVIEKHFVFASSYCTMLIMQNAQYLLLTQSSQ